MRYAVLVFAALCASCAVSRAGEPSGTGLAPFVQRPAGAVEPAAETGTWAVMAGSTLKSTLLGWSRTAGWRLVWDHEGDYALRASVTFDGPFEKAVTGLVDAVYRSYPELAVDLYKGNRTIHVYTLAPATR
ncbi:TcpQ domain-containing protein [Amorphus sp. 3PC139-8]|uniref:TcpQ domain-containing protein n=1 Tax=Amorphus sp. 3PC139-8 TaxID=2735676 RepID=UPI00345D9637